MAQETVKAEIGAELEETRGDIEQAVSRLTRKKPWQPYLDAPLGFRNHWYPALFSHELGEGEVKGEVVLGERIVLKRVDGRVYALEDRCAHRGVRMSVRPECYTKNTLTCWYHGFTYNVTNGQLETIITQPTSPMKVTLQTYPVAERNGLIFVYVGDGAPPPLERDLPPGFLKDGMVTRGVRRTVHCSWRLGAENGFDFTHIYIHRNDALIKARGRLQPFATQFTADGRNTLELVEDEGGPKGLYVHSTTEPPIFEVQIEGQTIRSPRAPLHDEPLPPRTVITSIWLPGVLEVDNFPVPGTIQFEWYVALDDRRHTYWEVLGRPVESAEEERRFYEEVDDVWYTLSLTKGFNDSDVFAREQMDLPYGEEDFWYRERLFQPDLYIIQWRMLASRHNQGIQRRGRS